MQRVVGDAASYEEFVRARSGALYRTAYGLTGSRADAEDLLQVTLVKVYLSWGKVRRARSPEAYSRRVLVNAFLSGRRPGRFTREHLVAAPPEPRGAPPEADPSEALTLWPLVRALPPRQRAVIVLRYVNDLSEAEIADALGCAPGTVKSTASAALAALRARIGELS